MTESVLLEMSGFMGGRGAHGDGTYRLESARTGATEGDRPSCAAVTFGARRARGWRDGSRVAGSGIESQAGDLVRAEDSDRVRRRYADLGSTLAAEQKFLEFWQ